MERKKCLEYISKQSKNERVKLEYVFIDSAGEVQSFFSFIDIFTKKELRHKCWISNMLSFLHLENNWQSKKNIYLLWFLKTQNKDDDLFRELTSSNGYIPQDFSIILTDMEYQGDENVHFYEEYKNYSFVETYSVTEILTKQTLIHLFTLESLPLFSVKLYGMKLNNKIRVIEELFINKSHDKISSDELYIFFKNGKKECKIFSKCFYSRLEFYHCSEEEQKEILDWLSQFDKITSRKSKIKIEIYPKEIIPSNLKFVLLDIFMKQPEIVINERDFVDKMRISFKVDKWFVIKKESESLIFFKNSESITSLISLQYCINLISQILRLFNEDKDKIIDYYSARTKIVKTISQKIRKTGLRSNILKKLEPEIFDKFDKKNNNYPIRCQAKVQPYIVQNQKEFEQNNKNIEKIFEEDYNKNSDITKESYVLEFPTEDVEEEYQKRGLKYNKKRLYACIPRSDGNIEYRFPTLLVDKKGKYPTSVCCKKNYIKSQSNITDTSFTYILKTNKKLEPRRKGEISKNLSMIIDKNFYRKGYDKPNFKNILKDVLLPKKYSTPDYLDDRDDKWEKEKSGFDHLTEKSIIVFTKTNRFGSTLVYPKNFTLDNDEFVILMKQEDNSFELIRSDKSCFVENNKDLTEYLELYKKVENQETISLSKWKNES